jgi:hypothetical protein
MHWRTVRTRASPWRACCQLVPPRLRLLQASSEHARCHRALACGRGQSCQAQAGHAASPPPGGPFIIVHWQPPGPAGAGRLRLSPPGVADADAAHSWRRAAAQCAQDSSSESGWQCQGPGRGPAPARGGGAGFPQCESPEAEPGPPGPLRKTESGATRPGPAPPGTPGPGTGRNRRTPLLKGGPGPACRRPLALPGGPRALSRLAPAIETRTRRSGGIQACQRAGRPLDTE